MSVIISNEDDLKNIGLLYNLLYGSDIRIRPVEGKPYLALSVENGDYDVTGIVEGNAFNEAVAITIQRYIVELYTPLSTDGLNGSNFILLSRSLNELPLEQRINVLKAELLLVAQKIPQIESVSSISHKVYSGSNVLFDIKFTLITGELSEFQITGVIS